MPRVPEGTQILISLFRTPTDANRAFKRMTGVSPSEYRQGERAQKKPPWRN
jgi:AraC-like DNA-binding protein